MSMDEKMILDWDETTKALCKHYAYLYNNGLIPNLATWLKEELIKIQFGSLELIILALLIMSLQIEIDPIRVSLMNTTKDRP